MRNRDKIEQDEGESCTEDIKLSSDDDDLSSDFDFAG